MSSLLAFAQRPNAGQAHAGMTIRVEPLRHIREDVDLWPHIAHPEGDAELRVNATLTRLNKAFVKNLRDCDADIVEFEKGEEESGDPTKDDWSRSVEVTMRGPRFLSMVAIDGFFCGGAHPDDNLTVVVFDLQTGAQVDWSLLVGTSAGASSPTDVLGYEPGTTSPLRMPTLRAAYLAKEEAYCPEYFEDERSFFVWPDADKGSLIAEIAGLPHVAAPCKIEFKLTIEQARGMGFSEPLLRAIEEAHRLSAVHAKTKPVRPQHSPTAATRPH